MKKIYFLILSLILILVSCTDNPGVNKAFLKYGHKDGITSITVPGFVIRLAASLGDIDSEERELLRSIDKVKVLSVEDHHLNAEINLHEEFSSNINKDGRFDELLKIREDNNQVTVYGIMDDEDVIREMVILVGGDDNALVYLKGRLDPDVISKHINFANKDNFLSFDF